MLVGHTNCLALPIESQQQQTNRPKEWDKVENKVVAVIEADGTTTSTVRSFFPFAPW